MNICTHRRALTLVAAVAIVGGGGAAGLAVMTPATAAETYRDSAYGISATGAAAIAARPAVSSTGGQERAASGSASSSDGTVTIGSARVRAGGGTASATVTGFTAFGGLVHAASVTVTCTNGAATASVTGTPAGAVGKRGRVAYGVQSTTDGATTIIGMRVSITAGARSEASVINVGSATCAPKLGSAPSPSTASSTPTMPPVGPSASSRRRGEETDRTAVAPTAKPGNTVAVPVTG